MSLSNNYFFGIAISLAFYLLAKKLYKRFPYPIFNTFLISVSAIICCLVLFQIPLDHYMLGGSIMNLMLPVSILLLALPLIRQYKHLKEHKVAIMGGIIAGTVTAISSTIVLSLAFGLDFDMMVSLIPRSITTPLGSLMTESIGGLLSITIIAIAFNGLMGTIIYQPVFKLFRIHHPIAKGLAIGTTSHAIGTAKALELDELIGAMSGLAIVLAGVVTVTLTPAVIWIIEVL